MTNEMNVEGFRLSPQQQRLWRLQGGGAGRSFYAQAVVEAEGEPEAGRLRAAALDVLGRHEIFRTTFRELPGMKVPVQVVGDEVVEAAFEEHDLSAVAAPGRAEAVSSLLRELARRPFDFAYGPLVRLALVALNTDRHLLVFTLPSMCADAATLGRLPSELARAYAARAGGAGTPEPAFQYADFSEWRHEILEAEEAGPGKSHWSPQNFPAPAPPLPFERQAEGGGDFEPRVVGLDCGTELTALIAAASHRLGVSEETLLLTCWAALLGRLTGRDELAVRVAFDGRKYEQLRDALGPFAAHLPVRCRPGEADALADVLARVEREWREAHRWQEYYGPGRDEGGDTPSPFCFEYAVWPETRREAGVTFTLARQYICSERFRLKLDCRRRGGSLTTEFHFDARALSAQSVARVAAQYLALLASAASGNDGAALGALVELCAAERHHLLVEFNDTAANTSVAETAHRLFERQASHTPDRVALVYEDEQLTYGALNRRADVLARRLRQAGVGPEVPVAVYAERTPDTICAMLAVMKAGGAFVALDPAQPRARLLAMTAQLGDPLLIGPSRALSGGAAAVAGRVLYTDADDCVFEGGQGEDLGGGAGPLNLAYLLFTSGSTGGAKAVAVEHRQLVNYVGGIGGRLGLRTGESMAVVSTLAADLGYTSVFPALCGGGRLHLIAQERAADAEALADYFLRRGVDYLKVVPGHFRALLASGAGGALMPRRGLVLGGDVSGWEFVRGLRASAPGCEVFNHYGPTEATVGVMTYRVGDGDGGAPVRVPLGSPLPNSRVFVLDGRGGPTPVGRGGEIFIGGAGVARGYAGRPDLTAERFVPDPFSLEPGSRMYRTGDLARHTPAGFVEFLGRADHQVKVRGFRVELGEIEAALLAHPLVREAVVTVGGSGRAADEGRLAAYVATGGAEAPTPDGLREWLRARLPEYMVPSSFVALKELPRTANGKVDRRSLPEPAEAGGGAFVPPHGPVEEALAEVWAEVLECGPVGSHDDFFRLGGDSLLAIRITARVRKTLRVEMQPRHLFESPTVARLAAALAGREAQPGRLAAIARLRKRVEALPEGERQALLRGKSGAGVV